MQEIDMFIQADQLFESFVARIEDDQWDMPVPSTPEWNIRQLVNHVARNNLDLIAAITEGTPSRADDVLGETPVDAWSTAAQTAEEAAESVDDYDRLVDSSFGDMTVADYIRLQTVDRTVHAWDLARALGSDEEFDPELTEKAYHYAGKFASQVRGAGDFGEEVAIGGDANAMEKLLALSGRED